jgi:hypothetical protein
LLAEIATVRLDHLVVVSSPWVCALSVGLTTVVPRGIVMIGVTIVVVTVAAVFCVAQPLTSRNTSSVVGGVVTPALRSLFTLVEVAPRTARPVG